MRGHERLWGCYKIVACCLRGLIWISLCNLRVLCVSVVKYSWQTLTTETQRIQRLHREEAQTKRLDHENTSSGAFWAKKNAQIRGPIAFFYLRRGPSRLGYGPSLTTQQRQHAQLSPH